MRRLGVFGGTFDPVHFGHLLPAVKALETFRFDQLTFIPAGNPPHKQGEPLTAFSHRFAMLALATQAYDRFVVSDIEQGMPAPTYTVDTLRAFRRQCGEVNLYFLMGSDSFSQIASWHRWRELVDEAHLVVLHRDTVWGEKLTARVPAELHSRMRVVDLFAPVPEPEPHARHVYLLNHEPFPISATVLRERLAGGLPIGELVPPQVHRYIVKHGLYHHERRDGE